MDAMETVRDIITDLDEKGVVAAIDEKINQYKGIRLWNERRWYQNFAFLMGEQWGYFNTRIRQMQTPPTPSWRVRLTTNLILPSVRLLIAKMLRMQPSLSVMPNTKEKEDIDAARVGTKVLQYVRRLLKLPMTLHDLALVMVVMGSSFLKPYFNPKVGPPVLIPATDENGLEKRNEKGELLYRAVTDEAGNELLRGDLDCDVCTPFEIWPDALAEDEYDARYIIHAKARSVEWVWDNFGVTVEPDKQLVLSGVEQQFLHLLGKKEPVQIKNAVMVKEYWEKPTKKYSKGRLITAAGKKLVKYSDELPWGLYRSKSLQLPFVKFDYFRIKGRFWGDDAVRHGIPLQKEYNRSRSQIIEHKNMMIKGKILIPITCQVSKTAFTSEPGEKVYYNPAGGAKPEQLFLKPLPADTYQNLVQIRSDLNDIFSIHEVSRAKVPSGIRSGVAIAYLQEQDDTQLGPTMQRFQFQMEQFGNLCLEIIQSEYVEDRLMKITGKYNEPEVFEFKGADLHDNTDVRVEMGSQLPSSKVARQQFILSMWDRGIIKDPKTILGMLEFGDPEEIFKGDVLDEGYAKAENRQMVQGIENAPQAFENHQIHLANHTEFMKTDTFRQLSPEIKMIFQTHTNMHNQMAQQQQAAFMQMQQLMKQMGGGQRAPRKRQRGGATD